MQCILRICFNNKYGEGRLDYIFLTSAVFASIDAAYFFYINILKKNILKKLFSLLAFIIALINVIFIAAYFLKNNPGFPYGEVIRGTGISASIIFFIIASLFQGEKLKEKLFMIIIPAIPEPPH